MQPEAKVMVARTNPNHTNFIMLVPFSKGLGWLG